MASVANSGSTRSEFMKTKQLFYFGCMGQVGHGLYASVNGHVQSCSTYTPPGGLPASLARGLDGTFVPPQKWGCGSYLESSVPPWRIISWHDNSVDTRPGSHSTFIGCGFETVEEMIEAAREQFPEVFRRQAVRRGLHMFNLES